MKIDVLMALQIAVIAPGVFVMFTYGGFWTLLGLLTAVALFYLAINNWRSRQRRKALLDRLRNFRGRPWIEQEVPTADAIFTSAVIAHLGSISIEEITARHDTRDEVIGEASCINNAQSKYLRCAVNPEGPCEGCKHYETQA